MEVGQVDLAVGVDVFASFDHHGTGGLDEADGGVVGVGVQQPQTHRDVVHVPYERGEGKISPPHEKPKTENVLEIHNIYFNMYIL